MDVEQKTQLLQFPSQEWCFVLESLQGEGFSLSQQLFVEFSLLQQDISLFSAKKICLGTTKIPKQKIINMS